MVHRSKGHEQVYSHPPFTFHCMYLPHYKHFQRSLDTFDGKQICISSSCFLVWAALIYRVAPYVLKSERFLKLCVAFKWVKPRLQNFLCFLSILIAKFSENLVAIASTVFLSMAFLMATWSPSMLYIDDLTMIRGKCP